MAIQVGSRVSYKLKERGSGPGGWKESEYVGHVTAITGDKAAITRDYTNISDVVPLARCEEIVTMLRGSTKHPEVENDK